MYYVHLLVFRLHLRHSRRARPECCAEMRGLRLAPNIFFLANLILGTPATVSWFGPPTMPLPSNAATSNTHTHVDPLTCNSFGLGDSLATPSNLVPGQRQSVLVFTWFPSPEFQGSRAKFLQFEPWQERGFHFVVSYLCTLS